MIRIVVGTSGLDQPDDNSDEVADERPGQSPEIVARTLRDAGHEVIFTGERQSAEQLVATAIQEDADLIGLADPSGGQPVLAAQLVELLSARGVTDIAVVAGSAKEIAARVAELFSD